MKPKIGEIEIGNLIEVLCPKCGEITNIRYDGAHIIRQGESTHKEQVTCLGCHKSFPLNYLQEKNPEKDLYEAFSQGNKIKDDSR